MATTTSATRSIAAAPELVFDVIAHIENFSEAIPHIINVQFLTEQHRGVGTRFSETRLMRGREATTTLEVIEYEAPTLVRLVSDSGGAIWDTVFSVTDEGEGALLTMVMEARPTNSSRVSPFPCSGGWWRRPSSPTSMPSRRIVRIVDAGIGRAERPRVSAISGRMTADLVSVGRSAG
jgi:hypothetical protein